ncbi:uncharacterized protein LOC107359169 isoform X2 [Tetranychus urticae]|nr:uncharacterized protein LOC107359169 isoform X1 [Tetranychus urticae]XP_015781124.1 uncharacterized protein LOC107359169 isoform X2 [Tetranychus urticae]
MWLQSLIFNRSISEFGPSAFRLLSTPLFINVKFFQRCSQSSKSANYVWTHIRPPTENQKLFEILVGSEYSTKPVNPHVSDNSELQIINPFLADSNCRDLLNNSNRTENTREVYAKFFETIKKKEPDCLSKVSILLRKHFCDLIPTKAPFDSYWDFVKKLDLCLVKYCTGLKKDVWLKPNFIDECLQLTIELYKISPPTSMVYSDCLVKHILGKAPNLTLEQFLRLMFCSIISRRKMETSQVDWCQKFINQRLDSLSLAQLSLILVAFHKTKTHLTDDRLLKRILEKAGTEAESEPDATIRSSLLKGINYSLVMPDNNLSSRFVNSFLRLRNLTVYNYMHLCEFCVNKKFYCPELIDSSLTVMGKAIEHLREKDVERILKCATAFDHLQPPCPDLDKLIHQVDSSCIHSDPAELEKTIPSLLRSTFLLDIYPPNMIDFILSTNWSAKLNFYGHDIHLFYWLLMTIRDCLMIDKYPEYVGRLNNLDTVYLKGSRNPHLRTSANQIINQNSGKSSMNNRNFGLLYRAAMDAFPNQIVRLGYLLSTSLIPDLIVTPVQKHLRLLEGPIRTPNCFIKAHVLVYQTKQMYIDRNYTQISGHYRLRERLLQKLGVSVINIPFYEMYHKTDDDGGNSDLVDYIRRRIQEVES